MKETSHTAERRCIGPALAALTALTMVFPGAVAAETVSFNEHIKPILSENCYFCHGPDEAERKAGLRLDVREEALKERDGIRAVVPEHPDQSALIARILSADPEERMPPPEAKISLTKEEQELLRQWIADGAVYERHWAFVPPRRISPPAAAFDHPVDALVASVLREKEVGLSPPAARATLLRRLSLDLTGLPPSPRGVEAFRQDAHPNAYERLVERLLASPAFGERMAWDWLDAARYADSNGYQGDSERTMWPWRDWVVQAFNQAMPFDTFTVYQLAGDLLPDAGLEQRLATGFSRNHAINGEGGRIPEENRVEYVMDMTETMGTVWLGLTLNCCRCHDHKFDPLAQKEYYQLTAFFNQTPVDGSGGDPQQAPHVAVPDGMQKKELVDIRSALEEAHRALETARLHGGGESTAQVDKFESRVEDLEKRRKEILDAVPKVMVMEDREEPRTTRVLERGLYNKPTDPVEARVPVNLHPLDSGLPKNRLGLARWLMVEENPLTARVTVNRYWQMIFGVGLVKTSEDFGTQGETPPHQPLLDWLAVEFRENGWDVKALLRLIVTSGVYQQSSAASMGSDGVSNYELDPENRWLARGPRFRLPSWMLRDQALAAAGLLVPKVGGAPVNPYQPEGVWEEASFGNKKYVRDHGEKLYRRSLYTFWRRIVAPPMFFDNASRQVCSVKPFRTNTPLHALLTFNDVTFVEAARALAERVLREEHADDRSRMDQVFRYILARPARSEEAAVLEPRLERSRVHYATENRDAEALLSVGESDRPEGLAPAEHAAWTSLCLAIFNLDEALTKE